MESPRLSITGSIYGAIIVLTILMLVSSIPYGTYAIFSPNLSTSGYTYATVISSIPIYIGLLSVYLPITTSFGALFVTLTALYALFIVLAALQGGGLVKALRSSAREGMGSLLRNPLSATVMILGATLLATVLLDLLQTSVGVSAGGLSGDPYSLLVSFTLAPLIEEIGFRFFLIGVPLVIVMYLLKANGRRMLAALWRPSAAWDGVATETQGPTVAFLKLFVYFLIALSSVLFGLAHYLSGAGWNVGKISEAALDGVALAYLYMRYGLHTSIIFHWVVDFASNAFAFYGQAAYGISWTANSAYSLIPTVDLIIIVGLPGLLYFLNVFLRRVLIRGQNSPLPSPAGPESSGF